MSRCLVIGANGFLGSYLVDALASRGHEVTAFDRFSSQVNQYTAKNVRAFVGDFLNTSDLAEALKGQELVFHFLSTTNPATADSEPTLDIRTNISQSVEFFRLCVDHSIRKLYFASTGGAIYGDQDLQKYAETSPTLPVSPYGIGKLTLENYLRYFHAKHGLESVSLRISNPYGPRQHPHRKQGLIPIALKQIASERPVIRFGSGTMTRDYIFANDVSQIIAGIAGASMSHQIYNLGSAKGHTVTEVLNTIREVTGRDFEVREHQTPPTFVESVILDTTRLEAEMPEGILPLSSLRDGIAATWAAALHSPESTEHPF
ncbi:UDP-glucose 4-epimerase [Leifsonia rubra CMS 76R]|nr:UDP-glucose 4-epimerase [Leifsonia rubra CMS 76R]